MVRLSHHIRRQQATNIKPAIRLAEKRETPLNHFVTINFTHLECDEATVSDVFAAIRERFGRWLRGGSAKEKRRAAAFVWVIENGGGHLAAHWLVHVPDSRRADFEARLLGWVSKETGVADIEGTALDVKFARTPLGAGKYMMKGIDPAFAAFYGITHVPQGQVHGKRCGFSQSLGPSSCRRERTYYTQMRADRRAVPMNGVGLAPAAA
ncbi:MAG: hypothetical protein E6Q29_09655 [Alicycliphilus sp.]|jgi:hypothetical protein|nr:MAG: hypothetical protein E6Q29_09655 [Alicycliphilus sp.]